MNIGEFRDAATRRPFRGLAIRLADGTELEVSHPENLAYDLETRTAAIKGGRGWEVIDVDLVTSIRLPWPARTAEPQ